MEYELYHHGVIGMKWGVRRYQNKDGSLTPAGKKRAAKLEAKYEKVTGKKIGDAGSSGSGGKKYMKDMTDEELVKKINRNRLEAEYIRSSTTLSELNPAPITKGQKFMKGLSDSLTPTLQNAGKKLVTDYLEKEGRKLLGLKEDDFEAIKREAERLGNKKKIHEINKYFENEKNKAKNSKDDDKNSKSTKENDKNSENKKTETKTDKSDDSSKVFEGEVTGEGTSTRRSRESSRYDGPIIDVEYTDVSSSALVPVGQNYVNRLMLEDKNR